ncbi:hypothetical protein H4S02_000356 [Coemansia sp. RSA 2611]|nr:hypothetical protein H4S01_000577 [Coemansia sp. RSA 2610]KAJ2393205.1 hypothetical protein H4S02_000356 [Coemansia sp. RSA 2611]
MLTSLALLAATTAFNLAVAHPAALAAATVPVHESSHELAEALPASTVFTERDSSDTQRQLREIYCPTRDCKGGRDWLAFQPSTAAGWAVGSVAFLAGGLIFRSSKSTTCAAMIDLGIALFLRAGLNYEHGNKRSIYIASLFFHYNAATVLFVGVMNGAFSLRAVFDETKVGRAVASTVFSVLVNAALFAMVVAGVVISFREETLTDVNVGWRLIQAVLYIMVIMMGLALVVSLRNSVSGSGTQTLASLVVMVAVVLIGLWSSFMLSRTYLPLSNVTRSSEVAWYMLGVAPLLIIGIVF